MIDVNGTRTVRAKKMRASPRRKTVRKGCGKKGTKRRVSTSSQKCDVADLTQRRVAGSTLHALGEFMMKSVHDVFMMSPRSSVILPIDFQNGATLAELAAMAKRGDDDAIDSLCTMIVECEDETSFNFGLKVLVGLAARMNDVAMYCLKDIALESEHAFHRQRVLEEVGTLASKGHYEANELLYEIYEESPHKEDRTAVFRARREPAYSYGDKSAVKLMKDIVVKSERASAKERSEALDAISAPAYSRCMYAMDCLKDVVLHGKDPGDRSEALSVLEALAGGSNKYSAECLNEILAETARRMT